MYHYRCLNHLPTPLYHCIISKVCLQIFGNICFVYICVTNPSSTNTSGYICIYFFQRKKSTLKCVEPRKIERHKNTIADCRIWRRVYRKSTVILMGSNLESGRDHLKLRHRKEGEKKTPFGERTYPPLPRQLLKMGFLLGGFFCSFC